MELQQAPYFNKKIKGGKCESQTSYRCKDENNFIQVSCQTGVDIAEVGQTEQQKSLMFP